MTTEYEKRIEERRIIKEETRSTIIIGLCLIGLNIILGVAASLITLAPLLTEATLDKLYGIVNLAVIMLMIAILAVRKTIYYSPKFIREDFTLPQVLQKWKHIDLTLLLISQVIPICGLTVTFLGMPFDQSFHFFVASGLLIILLMPMSIKVRSKLSILKTHFPEI